MRSGTLERAHFLAAPMCAPHEPAPLRREPHISPSSISYKNAGDLAEEVRALLALHRVSTTAAGYVVGPAAEIAPLT